MRTNKNALVYLVQCVKNIRTSLYLSRLSNIVDVRPTVCHAFCFLCLESFLIITDNGRTSLASIN